MSGRWTSCWSAVLEFTALLLLVHQGSKALSFDSLPEHSTVFPTYRSEWSNRSVGQSGESQVCRRHDECGQYEFCFGKIGFGNAGVGLCQSFFSETCTEEYPCDVGDGDCDTDFDCVSDLVCGA